METRRPKLQDIQLPIIPHWVINMFVPRELTKWKQKMQGVCEKLKAGWFVASLNTVCLDPVCVSNGCLDLCCWTMSADPPRRAKRQILLNPFQVLSSFAQTPAASRLPRRSRARRHRTSQFREKMAKLIARGVWDNSYLRQLFPPSVCLYICLCVGSAAWTVSVFCVNRLYLPACPCRPDSHTKRGICCSNAATITIITHR